jgi:hypothetical protein
LGREAVVSFKRQPPGRSKTIIGSLLASAFAALLFSMGNPMLFERYATIGLMLAVAAGALSLGDPAAASQPSLASSGLGSTHVVAKPYGAMSTPGPDVLETGLHS